MRKSAPPPLTLAIPADSSSSSGGFARAASLLVLVLQNTALALLLHASRTRADYSAATAVLVNELLKGVISLYMAYRSTAPNSIALPYEPLTSRPSISERSQKELEALGVDLAWAEKPATEEAASRLRRLAGEIFSADCWKLGVPAVVYVIQNNLQFVAAANLDVATFQITYQLKILTTALFSVLLLKKSLSKAKWSALMLLAAGVALVQLSTVPTADVGFVHTMNRVTGFAAVLAACLTSGLAGVYFEMVLKGSSASLWVRNVQLSIFSIIPALLPALRPWLSGGSFWAMFDGFGGWAWAVVWCQVIGGLATALVIKYSDNIVKGFATSLAIVLSCVASALFFPHESQLCMSFVSGTVVVLGATYLYNSSDNRSAGSPIRRLSWPTVTSSTLLPIYSPLSSRRSSSSSLSTIEEEPHSPLLISSEYGVVSSLLASDRRNSQAFFAK